MSVLNKTLLGTLSQEDSIIYGGWRLPSGATYLCGQVGQVTPDLEAWVDDNAFAPHRAKSYWGYWAFNPIPLRATAQTLSITQATAYEGDDEVARVPSLTPLTATWGMKFDAAAPSWRVQLIDTVTGIALYNGLVTGSGPTWSQALPALGENQTAVLRVRIETGKPDFDPANWPPPGYSSAPGTQTITWRAAGGGADLHYDPVYHVGAYCSQPNHPTQKARAAVLTAGTGRKNPAWTGWLTVVDVNGVPESSGGEWAALKIAPGTTVWPDESNIHAGARWECLWLANQSGGAMTGTMTAVAPPDCRIRAIGCLREDADGNLMVPAMVAGRSGRQVALYRVESGSPETVGYGFTLVGSYSCECALSSEVATGLVYYDDQWWLTTFCELFQCATSYPVQSRLIGHEPGGRSLGLVVTNDGRKTLTFATEGGDFASSSRWPDLNSHIVYGRPGAQRSEHGPAHQVDSNLAFWGGRAYYVEEAGPGQRGSGSRSANYQYLRYFNGVSSSRVTSSPGGALGWRVTKRDMGPVGACGDRLLVFGHSAALDANAEGGIAFTPTVSRFTGTRLEHNATLGAFVRNAVTIRSLDGSRDNLIFAGRSYNAGTVSPYYSAWETDGSFDTDPVPDPDIPDNAGDAIDDMPDGTVARIIRVKFSNFCRSVMASEKEGGDNGVRAILDDYPYALWVRSDGTVDIPDIPGESMTPELHTALESFVTLLPFEQEYFLGHVAEAEVAVCLLIPPGYDAELIAGKVN